MFVVKRDGSREEVKFDKIFASVSHACQGLEGTDPALIAKETIAGLHDGSTTKELDLQSINQAVMRMTEEPNYGYAAARLLAGMIRKEVGRDTSFLDYIRNAHAQGLVNDWVLDLAHVGQSHWESIIDHTRDYKFTYFGLKTVYDRYLLRDRQSNVVIERPQWLWLRVALGLANNVEEAIREYHHLSQFHYMAATPTLFNSGTNHQQMSSCYLLELAEDSIDGIYKAYSDSAKLSKWAGGIGFDWTPVRSAGSKIKGTNGQSSGLIPFLKTYDSSIHAVNQAGKRRGSAAVYLQTWHADVEEFLELRNSTGPEERRTHNLNLAHWVPDLFMKRVEQDGDWSLFSPSACPELVDLWGEAFERRYEELERLGLASKTVKARSLYAKMMTTLAETGNGWMCFKDTSNSRSALTLMPQNVIHSSNLCVAPETMVLTDKGHVPIHELAGKSANVWNGFEFSETQVVQTGQNQKLIQVTLSNGVKIDCTPYHKFILADGTRVEAQNLTPGDKLVKSKFPVIGGDAVLEPEMAYTHGFFCGDGTYGLNERPQVSLYADKKELVGHLMVHSGSGNLDGQGRLNYALPKGTPTKFLVPLNDSIHNKLKWFAGLCDADACIARNGENESLQLASNQLDFLRQIRLMLQTLGVDSKITLMREAGNYPLPDGKGGVADFHCQEVYRLLITSNGLYQLGTLGFQTHRLKFDVRKPQRESAHFIKVVTVEDHGRIDDTFCFHEPLRKQGVFNGVLTGNCTEIDLITNAKETAVCNLRSDNLAEHVTEDPETGDPCVDWDKLAQTTYDAVIMLDRVIDRNFYPIPEAETSNKKWRPVGLGVMGWQDMLFKLRLPFDSDEAMALNQRIFEFIYYHALRASVDLAKKYGPFPAYAETRYTKGLLQFDLMEQAGYLAPDRFMDWGSLKREIAQYGLRNSQLMAIAPTATIGSIVGSYECIEPQVSNLFKRETLSGEFVQVNTYLVKDLKERGLWDQAMRDELVACDGSVQDIDRIPDDLKALYKTAWELSQKVLIQQAADRSAFICQSQSLNLFMQEPTLGKLSSMYAAAWKAGLKSTYYLRSRAKTRIAKTTVVQKAEEAPKTYSQEEVIACSLDNPGACEVCQ